MNKAYSTDYEKELRERLKSSPTETLLRLELATLLVKKESTRQEAKEILEDLLNSRKRKHAMFELGKLELRSGNTIAGTYYLTNLLNSQFKSDALIELGRIEKKNRNVDKAEAYFKKILQETIENPETNFYKAIATQQLIYIQIQKENYEQALFYFNSLLEYDKTTKFNSRDLAQIDVVLKFKLGLPIPNDHYSSPYLISQLENYKKEEALRHIQNHLSENGQKKEHTVFYPHINIEQLFEEIQEAISHETPYNFTLCDKYLINCPEPISEIDGTETKTIKVITLINTKNIITMYPVPQRNFVNLQLQERKKSLQKLPQ